MLKTRLNNKYTGIYRTQDDIDNLKIRVTLKKLYSTIHIPKFERIQSSTTNDEPSIDYVESVELKWQEKLFSKTERKYYEQKENCTSELEKRYHDDIIKEKDRDENENNLIFTYTSGGFIPVEAFYYIEKAEPGKLDIGEYIKLKNDEPKTDPFVEMHIMADLEPSISLFSIKYRKSDGLLLVYPDFNDSQNSYFIEIDQNSKQIYTYYIENISNTSSKATKKQKQEQNLNELVNETCEIVKKITNPLIDADISSMPKRRIALFIEILSAENFEHDNIHVQYKIILPKSTKLSDGCLEGSTHSSLRNEEKWHFGYGFSISLDIDDDEIFFSPTELEKIKITFNVISIDALWSRERHEGIASLKLPLESPNNRFESDLQCFRNLKSSNLIDMVERCFIGGIRNIEFDTTDNVHNYYGNTTVSTGVLKIKVQQIKEIQNLRMINTKLKSIDAIIDSYHKAKERLNF